MPNINLKKLWRRKTVTISDYDPTYKVTYLGNVLTGWAKGEGCVEKPLATLWRNYCQSNRPDISMKVTICGAGLKAVTKEHGLTEYWAHRVTYCSSHPAYPRVFCWVYRHEGRRLKQELRCHAVLCPKDGKAEKMASRLKSRLKESLQEFRREKIIRQNARLSLVHAVYDSAALPLRKVYLITGASNYRPPLERSKSAPRLGAIEEILEEEEPDEHPLCKTNVDIETNPNAAQAEEDVSEVQNAAAEGDAEVVAGLTSEVASLALSEEANSSDLDLESEGMSTSTANAEERPNFLLEEDEETSHLTNGYSVEMNFSSPDLLFYKVSPVENAPGTKDYSTSTDLFFKGQDSVIIHSSSPARNRSIPPSEEELDILSSFKDKLVVLRQGRGEGSLTSDQPESIGSHSCGSSCEGCSVDEITDPAEALMIMMMGGGDSETEEAVQPVSPPQLKKSISSTAKNCEEESDNISEESGYSEDKECLMAATTVKESV